MDFKPQDLPIFRPYPEEVPVDLVGDVSDLDFTRVAKLNGDVIAAYRIERTGATEFAIRSIGVVAAFRGRGVGRWMLGHAIGLAESKGGRTVDVEPGRARGFFEQAGFEALASGTFRLTLLPE